MRAEASGVVRVRLKREKAPSLWLRVSAGGV